MLFEMDVLGSFRIFWITTIELLTSNAMFLVDSSIPHSMDNTDSTIFFTHFGQ